MQFRYSKKRDSTIEKKGKNMKNIKLSKVKQYWKKCVKSAHCNMSRGAEKIHKIITRARGENWRRSDRKDKK